MSKKVTETPETEFENPADVILGALNVFRGGRKWLKESFECDGNYCLLGGVQAALGEGNLRQGENHPLYRDTITLIAQTLKPKVKTVREPESTIVRFNDSKRTTFANVEAVLAAALVRARKLAGISA